MPGCGFADIPDVAATGGQASLKQAETWRARRFIDRTIKHVLDSSTKASRSRTVADYKVAKWGNIVQNVIAAIVQRI